MRFEAVQHVQSDVYPVVSNTELNGHWLVVTMREEQWLEQQEQDANQIWRVLREKLEAVTVMSVLACTTSYAWRRNLSFWRRFILQWGQQDDRRVSRASPQTDATPAPRDDTLMPRFMVDFSYVDITPDIMKLLRHVLLGSEKSMRVSFKNAMETLSTMPPRTSTPATIQIALRFARSKFQGEGIVKHMVDLVKDLYRCKAWRQRELGNATSKVFYYEVVELDLRGVRLSSHDLHQLRGISQELPFRLVLENTLNASANLFTPFSALMGSWFIVGCSSSIKNKSESAKAIACVASISDLSLNSNALSSLHIASIFSALHNSGMGSPRRLSLRGISQRSNSRVLWSWAAFGLWCGDSRSKLVSLDLSSNALCREDVRAIRGVVASQQELRAKFLHQTLITSTSSNSSKVTRKRGKDNRNHKHQGKTSSKAAASSDKREPSSSWTRLDADTRLATEPTNAIPELLLTTPVVVRAVEEKEGYTAVLVPAYGFLWVKSSATKPANPPQNSSASASTLKELRLNSMFVSDEGESAAHVFHEFFSVLTFLTVTKLELDNNSLNRDVLGAVLAACPALKFLSLEDCELASIAPIVAAYRDGSCRVKHLNVADNQIGDHDVVDLCRVLARSPSIACSLRVLQLQHNPIGNRGLHALSHAIRESPGLAHLVLDREQDKDIQFRQVFYQFHDQFLSVEPLSSAHQDEFQRALTRRLGATALDESIVASIFAFAASSLHRRIDWV